MRLITSLVIVICLTTILVLGAWHFNSLRSFINRHLPAKYKNNKELKLTKKYGGHHDLREQGKENKVLLQLAQLYIISPERILLLLTKRNLKITCQDICDVLVDINSTTSASVPPLSPENLYLRLRNGLDHFYSVICMQNNDLQKKHLTNFHDCWRDLREELEECEGPADWFEKTNKAIMCQYYNDIVNCQYTKAAMICGPQTAQMLRTFSTEIMRIVVMFKCRVSRSLPQIDDPMTSGAAATRSFSIWVTRFKY